MNNSIDHHTLILASRSPRRIAMMQEHGLHPLIRPSHFPETIPIDGMNPMETAMYLALSKALDVQFQLKKEPQSPADPLIVAADTIVVLHEKILGKPRDQQDALSMLTSLSGQEHQVITGVTLSLPAQCALLCFYEISHVVFCSVPRRELETYVQTKEPYDKAGGYAVQGTFSRYIDRITGDRNNIIGFPWQRFCQELHSFLPG